jgi:hypothetical protein
MNSNFISQFKAAARVSTPLVAVRTFDPSSAVSLIKNSFKNNGEDIPLVAWDCMKGAYPYNNAGKKGLASLLGTQPIQATIKLNNVLDFSSNGWGLDKEAKDCILFLTNPHFFFKDPSVIQGIWNLRNVFKANGHMLVLLIAPGTTLPAELINDILVLDEPLPTRDKLAEIVVTNHKLHKAEVPTGDKLNKMVDAIVGLPEFGADQSVAMSIDSKSKVLDMDDLWHKKREIIKQTPGLSVLKPKTKLKDIGGNEQVIKFYRQLFEGPNKPHIIVFMDEIEKMFAGTGSEDGHKAELAGAIQSWAEDNNIRGGALVGLPGVGKTAQFEAMCGEYDVPGIRMDVAAMQDKRLGESGARLRSSMATILSVAGDEGKNILLLATSNGLDNLPLGLRARFSFAPTFFYDIPNETEKKQIWKIQIERHGLELPKTFPVSLGWSGRDIKQACEKAQALGISLKEAAEWVVPIVVTEKERIDNMRANAHNKYLSAAVSGLYKFNESEMSQEIVLPTEQEGRRIKE